MTKRSENKPGGVDERIFVKDGFRSFRRTYRIEEVYWGAGTGALLLGIVGWVTWKGAHPDPRLFDMSAALEGGVSPPGVATPVLDMPSEPRSTRDGRRGPAQNGAASGAAEGRGPLPAALAGEGFHEGKIGAYDSENLYVKINGRAGFFQSFGVKSLHTVSLEGEASGEAPFSVDIEVYDLAEARNAIGAYNGERPPGIESVASEGSTYHFDRNAGFLARGPYYVRFIGSDESAKVVGEVRRLLDSFRVQLAGEAAPWGFSLLVDQLQLSPSAVTYVKNNAFSFGFARDVYKASLSPASSKEDLEAFVVAALDTEAARAMAKQYQEGFASLGAPAGPTRSDVSLFKDEFLGTLSGALASERWVVGVRGAPSADVAAEWLERLVAGLAALPADVRARAVPSVDTATPEGAGAEVDEAAKPAEENGHEY